MAECLLVCVLIDVTARVVLSLKFRELFSVEEVGSLEVYVFDLGVHYLLLELLGAEAHQDEEAHVLDSPDLLGCSPLGDSHPFVCFSLSNPNKFKFKKL